MYKSLFFVLYVFISYFIYLFSLLYKTLRAIFNLFYSIC